MGRNGRNTSSSFGCRLALTKVQHILDGKGCLCWALFQGRGFGVTSKDDPAPTIVSTEIIVGVMG